MSALKSVPTPETTVPAGGETKRGQSGVSCPYFDLDASIKVAEAIHSQGGGACTADQLCHWLKYKTVKSGTFLTRVAAAKSFGLIQSAGGRFSVTDRGMAIVAPVMPEDLGKSKIDAFLAVELCSKVYEQFRGKQLPPEVGLKNLFKAPPYSILPDRIDPAVRVLMNSAEQAGILTSDRNRLVVPSTTASVVTPDPAAKSEVAIDPAQATEKSKAGFGGGSGDGTGAVHSAIVGLLRDLPAPGSSWPAPKKQRFLAAFQATIDHIYPED